VVDMLEEQFKIIQTLLEFDELTIEQQIEGIDAVNDIMQAINEKPIVIEEPEDVPDPNDETGDTGDTDGTPITVENFRGTGLGDGRIADLAQDGITTVEQLVELGQGGIDELDGISSNNAVKIFDRAIQLIRE